MAADRLLLEGKDWFREPEAAEYCGLALSEFRSWYAANGIAPRRVGSGKRGRKLYSRADLYAAIDRSPEWQPSTLAASPGISAGRRMVSTGDDPSGRLRPVRLRESAPRRKRS